MRCISMLKKGLGKERKIPMHYKEDKNNHDEWIELVGRKILSSDEIKMQTNSMIKLAGGESTPECSDKKRIQCISMTVLRYEKLC